jgi:hypothetical protein
MKKSIIASVASFLISIVAHAQLASVAIPTEILSEKYNAPEIKKETKAVRKTPPAVLLYEPTAATLSSFNVDFGDFPVDQWSLIDNFSVASFTQDGQSKCAYYDFNNNLVAITTEVHFADLPANARDHIANKYADYKASEVLYYDDNESNETDLVLYGQSLQDEDSYFVELENSAEKIVLHVSLNGDVSLFKKISR